MTRLLYIVLLFLSSPAMAGTADIKIMVEGPSCNLCSQTFTELLRREDSIDQVRVNQGIGLFTLDLKEAHTIENNRLTKLARDAGYKVVNIERFNR